MALLIKSKVRLLKLLPSEKLQERVNTFYSEQFREAIRAWLKAVLNEIPEYTGTARGTFKPLARTLNVVVTPGVKYYKREGPLRSRLKKGYHIVQGKRYLVGPASNEYGAFDLQDTKAPFSFSFSQNLPWALWNDIQPAPAWMTLPSNPPWEAINAGNRAYYERIGNIPTNVFLKALSKVMITSTIKNA